MSSSSSGGNTRHQSLKKTTREDHWSDSDTFTLIESWGKLFLQLDHSGLRTHHSQQVAERVNKCHVSTIHWSHNQCRNRLDTLKKKYKVEKNRVCNEAGYVSTWRFFNRLDFFIGPVFKHYVHTPLPAREVERKWFPADAAARGVLTPTLVPAVTAARGVAPVLNPYSDTPVAFKRFSDTPVSARELKRKVFSAVEAARGVFTPPQGLTRDPVVITERNWIPPVTTARGILTPPQELTRDSVVMTEGNWIPAVTTARGVVLPSQEWKVAPAVRRRIPTVMTARGVLPPPRSAVPVLVKDSDMDMEMWQASSGKRNADVKLKGNVNGRRRVEKERDECGQLAEALGRFVEVYEKVEEAKGRQLVELEKQRMRFTKDLEIQRMRLLMESQVQFEKLKWLMKSESDIFRKR